MFKFEIIWSTRYLRNLNYFLRVGLESSIQVLAPTSIINEGWSGKEKVLWFWKTSLTLIKSNRALIDQGWKCLSEEALLSPEPCHLRTHPPCENSYIDRQVEYRSLITIRGAKWVNLLIRAAVETHTAAHFPKFCMTPTQTLHLCRFSKIFYFDIDPSTRK